jgi:phage-related protein (TIGR01555 family)
MWVLDKLVNLVSGLGTAKDKTASNAFALQLLTRDQLEAAYRSDWLARKIIDIIPFDMTREWRDWQAEQPQIEALEEAERLLNVRGKVSCALQRARLYGGSVIYLGLVGSERPDLPLNINTVKRGSLEYLHVLSPHEITAGEIERDPLSPFYGEPIDYQIGQGTKIHPSRIVRFTGAGLPDPLNSPTTWGDPVLQIVYDAVQNAASSQGHVASLLPEMKTDVIRVPGLSDILSTDEGTRRLTSRFTYANTMKSMFNMLLLEGDGETGEKWEQKQLNLSGMPDLIRMYLQIAAGAADIPVTRLLGQSPAGLNSTGEGDIRNYYDHVAAKQNVDLRPALERLDEILIRHALGDRPKDVFYEFTPLWQLSESDQADIAKKKAEATKIYVDTGLLPQEAMSKGVQNQLIEDGTYPGFETALAEAPEIDFEEQAEQERQAQAALAAASSDPADE